MPPTRRRAQDYTGKQMEKLAKERDEDLQLRAQELTMVQAAEQEAKENEVVDLSGTAEAELSPADQPEALTTGPVEVKTAHRTVRIKEDLEDMTYGHGNNYTFEAGRTYKLPKDVADHLDAKGYVYH